MVDSFNKPGSDPAEGGIAAVEATSKTGSASLLSTTTGKLMVGGIAVVAVLGALAAIFMIFVLNPASDDPNDVLVPPVAVTTGTVSAEASPTRRPADDFEDTFAFRNPFQPTIKITLTPEVTADGGDGTVDGGDSVVDVPEDTLFLSSVSTIDGVDVANLVWNGTTYSLSEGESIPDTPWQVLSISGGTVVMLYGDSRVTLTVGQGISK
jgi:hypothetical protein